MTFSPTPRIPVGRRTVFERRMSWTYGPRNDTNPGRERTRAKRSNRQNARARELSVPGEEKSLSDFSLTCLLSPHCAVCLLVRDAPPVRINGQRRRRHGKKPYKLNRARRERGTCRARKGFGFFVVLSPGLKGFPAEIARSLFCGRSSTSWQTVGVL